MRHDGCISGMRSGRRCEIVGKKKGESDDEGWCWGSCFRGSCDAEEFALALLGCDRHVRESNAELLGFEGVKALPSQSPLPANMPLSAIKTVAKAQVSHCIHSLLHPASAHAKNL
jgi:hypothetical protein